MIIKEYRIILPFSIEEYKLAKLWSIAETSKNETGGGEGFEIVINEPYEDSTGKGQYTHKVYHLASKLPQSIRSLAPRGSAECHEKSKNSYPYCKTDISNSYMGDNFEISIETWYKEDFGEADNIHNITSEELKQREVEFIDIVNDVVPSSIYNESEDPAEFRSKTSGRGPLSTNWIEDLKSGKSQPLPHMCAYKLVRANFVWFGQQERVEKMIHRSVREILQLFNRRVYCWMDRWTGLTLEEIRIIEEKTKEELNSLRNTGDVKGMMVK